jgi:hypothetical protein
MWPVACKMVARDSIQFYIWQHQLFVDRRLLICNSKHLLCSVASELIIMSPFVVVVVVQVNNFPAFMACRGLLLC